jgi:hypothetical protein
VLHNRHRAGLVHHTIEKVSSRISMTIVMGWRYLASENRSCAAWEVEIEIEIERVRGTGGLAKRVEARDGPMQTAGTV